MAMGGGEPWAITDIPRGAGNPEWAPDGKRRSPFLDGAARRNLTAAKPSGDKPRESDVRVITEAVYRANGIPGDGFVDRDRPVAHLDRRRCRRTASTKTTPVALTSGEFARDQSSVVARRLTHLLHLRPAARVLLLPGDSRPLFRSRETAANRRAWSASTAAIGAYCLSPDGNRVAFVGIRGRPTRRARTRSLICGSRSFGAGTPRNLTASYDFDISGGLGGDQRAPRGQLPGGPIWSRDGARHPDWRRRAGQRQREAGRRGERKSRRPDHRQLGRHVATPPDAAAQKIAFVRFDANRRRRPPRDRRRIAGGAEEADDVQRRTVRPADDERARGAVVHELRRQEDSGLDPQAAGVRRVEEVPAHPADSRRPARGLRQHLHARVPVDGGQGLRRPLHEPARQLELRPGFRQHHPVQLPGRRLQGSDGGRGRGPEEGLHRRGADGRHRRQRRRTAHQLGRDADDALQGGGQPARHLRLGELLVHRRLHAVHADLVPQGAVRGSGGLRQALADHLRRRRSRRR